jgi:ribosomal protein L23
LVGKVEKRARKPLIAQEIMSNMDKRRKWKNVNTEERRRNYSRLRNELKRATDKAKKEYLDNSYFVHMLQIACIISGTN